MAVGSSMLATIRTAPPQWPHVLTSMLKTRLRRCAHVIERRFSSGLRWSLLAAVDSSSVGGRLPRLDGVSCARRLAFGAKTPWKRVRWARGGGTSAASLGMISTGSNSARVQAPDHLRVDAENPDHLKAKNKTAMPGLHRRVNSPALALHLMGNLLPQRRKALGPDADPQ